MFEIDGIKRDKTGYPVGYYDLRHHFETVGLLPKPNYIVARGSGLHLYYLFEKPLVLFPNVRDSLKRFKKAITVTFWNRYVTEFYSLDKIQFESVFQGFRLVGGVTKNGDRTAVFKVRKERFTAEELNKFVDEEDKIEIVYKSNLTLSQAKEKYPEWYENRIINKKPKGSWVCKRDLYDWWYKKIETGRKVGHRYYCMMILCVYAIKCGISREELEKDCYSLMENFDSISTTNDNRFTKKDLADALQAFEDKELVTYTVDTISKRSEIQIVKNKRNFRKQNVHLERARAVQAIDYPKGEWRNKDGRPIGSGNKGDIVAEWRAKNPNGKKIDCHRDTGLSRVTIDKWWE